MQGWVQTEGILLVPNPPKEKRIFLVINSYELRSMLFLFCASSAWKLNTKNTISVVVNNKLA